MKKRTVFVVSIMLILSVTAACFFACGETEPIKKEHETSKYVSHTMTVREDGTFKILQLTDIHFINSEVENDYNLSKSYKYRDEWAKEAITAIVEEADPDLIMVTGDSVFTLDTVTSFIQTNDNMAAFEKVAKFIDSFKIPWAFIFGNHDEEGKLLKTLKSAELTKQVMGEYLLSDEIKYCLYVEGPEDINGVGNYIINVVNRDGTTNMPLVMFDSGSYLRNIYDERDGKYHSNQHKYEWVHDDQLDWYEAAINDISRIEGRKVESIVFQHIPFPMYGTVINSYIEALTDLGEDWTDTIGESWTYGNTRTLDTEIGEITYHGGLYNDGAVASSFKGEYCGKDFDGGHEFERLVDFGSTKYVFCGHDHRNTFSFTYKGIRMSYSLSIDYSANGIVPETIADNQHIFDETAQRGGNLITIGAGGSVTVDQIHFTRNLYRETLAELNMSK